MSPASGASTAGRALLAAARAHRGPRAAAEGRRAARALEQLLGAEVVALLLLGSHAHGDAGAESDIDAWVVTREPPPDRPAPPAADPDLDLRIVPLAAFLDEGMPPFLCAEPVPVLFDPEGHAAKALRDGRALHAVGPLPPSEGQLAKSRAWAERMERRVRAELRSDPALAALRLARLQVRLTELYFEVRSLWSRTDRAALDYWRRSDPPVARILDQLASAPSLAARLTLVQRLRQAVLLPERTLAPRKIEEASHR